MDHSALLVIGNTINMALVKFQGNSGVENIHNLTVRKNGEITFELQNTNFSPSDLKRSTINSPWVLMSTDMDCLFLLTHFQEDRRSFSYHDQMEFSAKGRDASDCSVDHSSR